MTPEERKVWFYCLKLIPIPFHRQKMIGNYIVDFYCASAKTVIEIDGSQHYWADGEQKDKERDAYLNSLGITVLRFSNEDVNHDFDTVCNNIYIHLEPYIK
jgi:very-short-patch-repair endonuclease